MSLFDEWSFPGIDQSKTANSFTDQRELILKILKVLQRKNSQITSKEQAGMI